MKFSALIGFAVSVGVAFAAPQSIVETAQANPDLRMFVRDLVATDLVGALSGDGPFTVFAPTNQAFQAIMYITCCCSNEQLKKVLEYHVVSGVAAKSTDLTDLEVLLPLFSGKSLHVSLEYPGRFNYITEKHLWIVGDTNFVRVTTADVVCSNGVIHIVDAVLIPILSPEKYSWYPNGTNYTPSPAPYPWYPNGTNNTPYPDPFPWYPNGTNNTPYPDPYPWYPNGTNHTPPVSSTGWGPEDSDRLDIVLV